MPKLHELLATNASKRAQADKTRSELSSTFRNKSHLFTEKIVTYKPFGEGAPAETESQLDLQTTVPKELKWISQFLTSAIDSAYQVDEANTQARADVILENGTTLLIGVPATALLQLEKRAAELREFILAIPTLDPAKGFQPALDKGADIFVAREEKRERTKKTLKVLTLAAATDKHAAQAKEYYEDVPVGTVTTLEWSGLITTAAKGDMMSRVEDLGRSLKKARSRANEQDIPKATQTIGQQLVGYVFGQ